MYEYAQAYGDAQLKAKYPAKAGITDKDWSSHTWGDNACLGKDLVMHQLQDAFVTNI